MSKLFLKKRINKKKHKRGRFETKKKIILNRFKSSSKSKIVVKVTKEITNCFKINTNEECGIKLKNKRMCKNRVNKKYNKNDDNDNDNNKNKLKVNKWFNFILFTQKLGDYCKMIKFDGIKNGDIFHLEFRVFTNSYPIFYKIMENWINHKIYNLDKQIKGNRGRKIEIPSIFKRILIFGFKIENKEKLNERMIKLRKLYFNLIEIKTKTLLKPDKIHKTFNHKLTVFFDDWSKQVVGEFIKKIKKIKNKEEEEEIIIINDYKKKTYKFIRAFENNSDIFCKEKLNENTTIFNKILGFKRSVRILNPFYFI